MSTLPVPSNAQQPVRHSLEQQNSPQLRLNHGSQQQRFQNVQQPQQRPVNSGSPVTVVNQSLRMVAPRYSPSNLSPRNRLPPSNISPQNRLPNTNINPRNRLQNPDISPQNRMPNPNISPQNRLPNSNISPQNRLPNSNISPQNRLPNSNISPQNRLPNSNLRPQNRLPNSNISPGTKLPNLNLRPQNRFPTAAQSQPVSADRVPNPQLANQNQSHSTSIQASRTLKSQVLERTDNPSSKSRQKFSDLPHPSRVLHPEGESENRILQGQRNPPSEDEDADIYNEDDYFYEEMDEDMDYHGYPPGSFEYGFDSSESEELSEEEAVLLEELRNCDDDERYAQIVQRLQEKGVDRDEIEELLIYSNYPPDEYPEEDYDVEDPSGFDGGDPEAEGQVSSSSQSQTPSVQNLQRHLPFAAGPIRQAHPVKTPAFPTRHNLTATGSGASSRHIQPQMSPNAAKPLPSFGGTNQTGKVLGQQGLQSKQHGSNCPPTSTQVNSPGQEPQSQHKFLNQGSLKQQKKIFLSNPNQADGRQVSQDVRKNVQVRPEVQTDYLEKDLSHQEQWQGLQTPKSNSLNRLSQSAARSTSQTELARPRDIATNKSSDGTRTVQNITTSSLSNKAGPSGNTNQNQSHIIRKSSSSHCQTVSSDSINEFSGPFEAPTKNPPQTDRSGTSLFSLQQKPQGYKSTDGTSQQSQHQVAVRSEKPVSQKVEPEQDMINSAKLRAAFNKDTAPSEASLARLNVLYMQQSLDQEIKAKKNQSSCSHLPSLSLKPNIQNSGIQTSLQSHKNANQQFLQEHPSHSSQKLPNQNLSPSQPKNESSPHQSSTENTSTAPNQNLSSRKPICSVVPFNSVNQNQASSKIKCGMPQNEIGEAQMVPPPNIKCTTPQSETAPSQLASPNVKQCISQIETVANQKGIPNIRSGTPQNEITVGQMASINIKCGTSQNDIVTNQTAQSNIKSITPQNKAVMRVQNYDSALPKDTADKPFQNSPRSKSLAMPGSSVSQPGTSSMASAESSSQGVAEPNQRSKPEQIQQKESQAQGSKQESFSLTNLSKDKCIIRGKGKHQGLVVNMVYQIRSPVDGTRVLAMWNGERFEDLQAADVKALRQSGVPAASRSPASQEPVGTDRKKTLAGVVRGPEDKPTNQPTTIKTLPQDQAQARPKEGRHMLSEENSRVFKKPCRQPPLPDEDNKCNTSENISVDRDIKDVSRNLGDGPGKRCLIQLQSENPIPVKRIRGANEPVTMTILSDEDERPSMSTNSSSHIPRKVDIVDRETTFFPSEQSNPHHGFRDYRMMHHEDEEGHQVHQQLASSHLERPNEDEEEDEEDENEPPVYEIDIRSVRIGSMRTQPEGPLLISLQGVCFRAISERTEEVFECEIMAQDVEHVKYFSGQTQPVLFLFLSQECGEKLRDICHMEAGDDEFFDPGSSDMKQKMVVIIIESFSYMPQEMLRETLSLWSDVNHADEEEFIEELTEETSNDLLIQSAPPVLTADIERDVGFNPRQGRETYMMTPMSQDSDSPCDSPDNEPDSTSCSPPESKHQYYGEPVRLLQYPPPPAKRLSITTEDLYCLTEGEFLNDVIIDFYLQYLYHEKLSEENRRRTHIFSSFFYKRLTQRDRHVERTEEDAKKSLPERRHARVKKWTKTVDLFSKDFIIIPINEHSHWYLAVVCFPGLAGSEDIQYIPSLAHMDDIDEDMPISEEKADEDTESHAATHITIFGQQLDQTKSLDNADSKLVTGQKLPCILIFDSLAGPNRNPNVQMIRDYLQCEWNAKKSEPRQISKIIQGSIPMAPQQSNYSDCGVYLLQYVESFFEDPIADYRIPMKGLQQWFPEELVQNKRREIHELIMTLHRQYQEELGDPRILDLKFKTREQPRFHSTLELDPYPEEEDGWGFDEGDEDSNSSMSGEWAEKNTFL